MGGSVDRPVADAVDLRIQGSSAASTTPRRPASPDAGLDTLPGTQPGPTFVSSAVSWLASRRHLDHVGYRECGDSRPDRGVLWVDRPPRTGAIGVCNCWCAAFCRRIRSGCWEPLSSLLRRDRAGRGRSAGSVRRAGSSTARPPTPARPLAVTYTTGVRPLGRAGGGLVRSY
jgi:hypothetical protein